MKKLITLFLISTTILSCKTEKKSDRNIELGDTITTSTGLKYAFLKEGFGRKVEEGSKVKVYTDLYLNDADTTIWRTAEDKDSVFAFIHKKTYLQYDASCVVRLTSIKNHHSKDSSHFSQSITTGENENLLHLVVLPKSGMGHYPNFTNLFFLSWA